MKEKLTDKNVLLFINMLCLCILAAIIIPLLMLSQYNYPTADDWSFGKNIYDVINGTESGIIRAIGRTIKESYQWEPRFIALLFAAVQPGAFGEQYYIVVAYIMIGALVLSELFLVQTCLAYKGNKNSRLLIMPILIPILAMQIMYCPNPAESFYWYTGAVNYTFIFCVSLVLLALTFKIAMREMSKLKRVLLSAAACILSFLIGGNNFATSLSTLCTLILIDIIAFIFDRKIFKRIWFISLPILCSFLMCVCSPYTSVRIEANFSGKMLYSPLEAVWMSIYTAGTMFINWRDIKTYLVLVFIVPFVWKAVKNIDFSFRFPGLFTIFTFGLYASQLTATMYVDGTVGGGRQLSILWYAYLLVFTANIFYWCGWLEKKKIIKAVSASSMKLLAFCAAVGLLILAVALPSKEMTSTYRAYRALKSGEAQQYGEVWENRIKVLKDDSVKQVEFEPLPSYDIICWYTDFDVKNGIIYWVNSACATYYNKEYVDLVQKE